MARRKSSNFLQDNMLLVIGIVLLVVCAVLLGHSNSKINDCESIGGKIVQFMDNESRTDCSQYQTMFYLSIVGLVIGAALIVVNFVKKK